MHFLIPAGLWALSGLVVVAAIYFFQRRFRPHKINALFLWQAALRRHGGGYKISWIETSLLLLLEIVAVAMLALAIASPGCKKSEKKHRMVFVLDDSASMSANDSTDGTSSCDRAKDEILSTLSKYSPFDASFIISGEIPKTAGSGISEISEAKKILSTWHPKKISHDIETALDLAFLAGEVDSCVYLATDIAPPSNEKGETILRKGLIWNSFGKKLDNLAFVTASRKFNSISGKEDIFAEIANYSPHKKQINLRAQRGGEILFDRKFLVPATSENSETLRVNIEIPARLDFSLSLSITEKDAILQDNSLLLISEKKPIVKTFIAISDNSDENNILIRYLVKALNATGAEISKNANNADIIISRNQDNWTVNQAWRLIFPREDKHLSPFYGPYISDNKSALTENLNLEGIRWTAFAENTMPGAIPLISYRNTLLFYEIISPSTQNSRFFIMNYFITQSNLHHTSAWPVFFLNLLTERVKMLPGMHRKNFRLGENISVKIPLGDSLSLLYSEPDTTEQISFTVDEFGSAVFRPEFSGLCDLRFSQAKELSTPFAVNFLCPEESDLTNLKSCVYGTENFKTIEYSVWQNFSWIFLLLTLLFALTRSFMIIKKEGIV